MDNSVKSGKYETLFYNEYFDFYDEEDIKNVSRQIDFAVAGYQDFKKYRHSEVLLVTKIINNFNLIAIENGVTISVDVMGDIICISLVGNTVNISGKFFTLFKDSLNCCDDFLYSSDSITVYYTFGKKI